MQKRLSKPNALFFYKRMNELTEQNPTKRSRMNLTVQIELTAIMSFIKGDLRLRKITTRQRERSVGVHQREFCTRSLVLGVAYYIATVKLLNIEITVMY